MTIGEISQTGQGCYTMDACAKKLMHENNNEHTNTNTRSTWRSVSTSLTKEKEKQKKKNKIKKARKQYYLQQNHSENNNCYFLFKIGNQVY